MRITITMLFVLLAAGCMANSNQNSGIQHVGMDADQLNAGHSRFEATEDPPFTAQTRYAAGQLAESQGRPDAAMFQYKEAIKIDSQHQASLYRMGFIYTKVHQFPEAIEAWKQYIKATNYAATSYSNLGFCYEQAGQNSEAEWTYKTGIKRDPNNQACRSNYGLMLARLGRIDEAKEQLAAVLAPAEVHYNLASVYELQGKPDQARAEYERALELDPKLWEARSRLMKLTRID
jgi:tetratricopeptide (TPR) repeat protein